MPTLKLVIHGKVQGVFFRASASKIAELNHITGWIKNTADGKVEALVTGNSGDIKQFTNWCSQGPPKANVNKVETVEIEEIDFPDFKIL
ncbi:MAG: acylphosphatase [Ferruginibacter sp.]